MKKNLPPRSRRWRQVQVLDESWLYEEIDSEYVAQDTGEENGWRPLATAWYCQAVRSLPWRTQIHAQGVASNEDHKTLVDAKSAVLRKLPSRRVQSFAR